MSLVAGRGPLGPNRAGWFTEPVPSDVAYVEPHPRRVQAVIGTTTVLDTERALMVHRAGGPLSYVFPPDDVGSLPHTVHPDAPGYVAVPWGAVDGWFEEGRRLVHYPPNPYHRVDCRPTRRGLRVEVAGAVLVDTVETVIVFETAVSTKLYVDPIHVRTDLLHRSSTTTYCNYKGWATYWSGTVGETTIDDVAWSYDDPLPESMLIKGFLSFDPTKVAMLAELPSADVAHCGCDVPDATPAPAQVGTCQVSDDGADCGCD